MKNLLYLAIVIFLSSCIGDDFINDRVDPEIRITSDIESLEINSTHQFEYIYLNNVGANESVAIDWSSSDPSIVSVDNDGLATALSVGVAIISAEFIDDENTLITAETSVRVENTTNGEDEDEEDEEEEQEEEEEEQPETRQGLIETTTFYTLTGTFTITEEGNGIRIDIEDDYEASTGLPGLYLYLSNNPNSIANAREVERILTFSGAHSFVVEDVGIDDYSHLLYFCKPFNVKVGDGEIQ
jgi:hypothetical protein